MSSANNMRNSATRPIPTSAPVDKEEPLGGGLVLSGGSVLIVGRGGEVKKDEVKICRVVVTEEVKKDEVKICRVVVTTVCRVGSVRHIE